MTFEQVERLEHVDGEIFTKIVTQNPNKRPIIINNCPFGDCLSKWNLNYLNDKLQDESIVIHESDTPDLDFLEKNFKYKTYSFREFASQLQEQPREGVSKSIYLRSTNRNPRSKKPARIEDDFPNIRDDLKPASFIPFADTNKLYHSSILRIASSNVQIWTHFDLYDNVLVQVVGVKRIILFPPEDIQYLYVKNDKSLVRNLDNWSETLKLFPLLQNATPYKCLLNPGETLFIPALWWHNIKTIDSAESEGHSIGFNIFWKDSTIETGDSGSLYADADVYGNKNLKPVESALANLDKAINHIDKLPGKYKTFYKHLLMERLRVRLFPS